MGRTGRHLCSVPPFISVLLRLRWCCWRCCGWLRFNRCQTATPAITWGGSRYTFSHTLVCRRDEGREGGGRLHARQAHSRSHHVLFFFSTFFLLLVSDHSLLPNTGLAYILYDFFLWNGRRWFFFYCFDGSDLRMQIFFYSTRIRIISILLLLSEVCLFLLAGFCLNCIIGWFGCNIFCKYWSP